MTDEEEKPVEAEPGVGNKPVEHRDQPPSWGLIGIGFEFLATICAVGALGWYLDRRFNMFPWLTIAGAAVGFAAGLAMIVRSGRQAFKD